MPAHQHCDLFYPLNRGSAWVCHKLGNAPVPRSRTGSWVLSGSSSVRNPLFPVIRLGLRNPKKKERKINRLCSLTDVCISQKYFTYCSVQIFQILVRRFYGTGSDLPHKSIRYWFYSSKLLSRRFPKMVRWKCFVYQACTSSKRANRRGGPLNIFT